MGSEMCIRDRKHAWTAAEEHYGCRFDLSLFLEPSSPMRMPVDVERTVQALLDEGAGAAATVSPTPAHFAPHKTLMVSNEGLIEFYLDEGAKFAIRQGIPQYYHRNGICYAAMREHVVERGLLLEENAAAVIVERPVVNIDESFELDLAEWLLDRQMH